MNDFITRFGGMCSQIEFCADWMDLDCNSDRKLDSGPSSSKMRVVRMKVAPDSNRNSGLTTTIQKTNEQKLKVVVADDVIDAPLLPPQPKLISPDSSSASIQQSVRRKKPDASPFKAIDQRYSGASETSRDQHGSILRSKYLHDRTSSPAAMTASFKSKFAALADQSKASAAQSRAQQAKIAAAAGCHRERKIEILIAGSGRNQRRMHSAT